MAAAVEVLATPGRTSGATALLAGGARTRAGRDDAPSRLRAGMRTTHLPDQRSDRLHQQLRLRDRIAAALQLDPQGLPRPPSTSRPVHHTDRHVRHRRSQNAVAVDTGQHQRMQVADPFVRHPTVLHHALHSPRRRHRKRRLPATRQPRPRGIVQPDHRHRARRRVGIRIGHRIGRRIRARGRPPGWIAEAGIRLPQPGDDALEHVLVTHRPRPTAGAPLACPPAGRGPRSSPR